MRRGITFGFVLSSLQNVVRGGNFHTSVTSMTAILRGPMYDPFVPSNPTTSSEPNPLSGISLEIETTFPRAIRSAFCVLASNASGMKNALAEDENKMKAMVAERVFIVSTNVRVHRARTVNVASKSARKPGFACNTLLSGVRARDGDCTNVRFGFRNCNIT